MAVKPDTVPLQAVSVTAGDGTPTQTYVKGEDGIVDIFRITWPSAQNDAMVLI